MPSFTSPPALGSDEQHFNDYLASVSLGSLSREYEKLVSDLRAALETMLQLEDRKVHYENNIVSARVQRSKLSVAMHLSSDDNDTNATNLEQKDAETKQLLQGYEVALQKWSVKSRSLSDKYIAPTISRVSMVRIAMLTRGTAPPLVPDNLRTVLASTLLKERALSAQLQTEAELNALHALYDPVADEQPNEPFGEGGANEYTPSGQLLELCYDEDSVAAAALLEKCTEEHCSNAIDTSVLCTRLKAHSVASTTLSTIYAGCHEIDGS